jgi:hypothetical protein
VPFPGASRTTNPASLPISSLDLWGDAARTSEWALGSCQTLPVAFRPRPRPRASTTRSRSPVLRASGVGYFVNSRGAQRAMSSRIGPVFPWGSYKLRVIRLVGPSEGNVCRHADGLGSVSKVIHLGRGRAGVFNTSESYRHGPTWRCSMRSTAVHGTSNMGSSGTKLRIPQGLRCRAGSPERAVRLSLRTRNTRKATNAGATATKISG